MKGNVEGRIGRADRGYHLVGAGIEPAQIDSEMRKPSFKAELEQMMGAFSHRCG
ncbi:hypothetical protein MAE02_36220 [Microvirga aerophila]|uniref:Uncharacterized protein n=1 Tax=Microvirga aerophila TaxID=670291 RepID=A0A512BVD8_9HYPH|nr:hypothetical protein MAE02_36220 [Microvirga aerophila]